MVILPEETMSLDRLSRIFIDNAAGVSFQRCTNPDSQIKGVFDLRVEWVRELRNSKKVSAMKVDTMKKHC